MRSKLQITSNIKVELDLKKKLFQNLACLKIFSDLLTPKRCIALKIYSLAKTLRCSGSAVRLLNCHLEVKAV